MKKLLLPAIIVSLSAAASAKGLSTISELIADPAKYDGKQVCSDGVIKETKTVTTKENKTIYLFNILSGEKTMWVQSKTSFNAATGDTVMACGIFKAKLETPKNTYSNILKASSLIRKAAK